jgi:hypothetical protein
VFVVLQVSFRQNQVKFRRFSADAYHLLHHLLVERFIARLIRSHIQGVEVHHITRHFLPHRLQSFSGRCVIFGEYLAQPKQIPRLGCLRLISHHGFQRWNRLPVIFSPKFHQSNIQPNS